MSALPTMRTTWRGAVAGLVVAAASLTASLPASAVAGQSKPAAPRIIAVTAGDGSVAVSWNPPAKTSVPAITSYLASTADGSASCAPENLDSLSCTITGLTNYVPVTIKVTATNDLGTSSPSTPKVATPLVPPAAPSIGTGSISGTTMTIPATSNLEVTGATYLWTVNDEPVGKASKTLKPLVLKGVGGDLIYRISLVESFGTASSEPATVNIPVQWGVRRSGKSSSVAVPVPRQGVTPVDTTGMRMRPLDLAGDNYSNLNLAGIDLSYADLKGTKFFYSNLDGANFTGADMRFTEYTHLHADNANFASASLNYSLLSQGSLVNAWFGSADCTALNLNGSDVTNAMLDCSWNGLMSGAAIIGQPSALSRQWGVVKQNLVGPYAMMQGEDFSGADLSGYNLSFGYLGGSDFTGATFSGAEITQADFQGANLTNANLSGTRFSFTGMRNVDLTGANLSGTRFYRVNFENSNLTNAVLTSATFSYFSLWHTNWTGDDLTSFSFDHAEGLPDTLPAGWTYDGNFNFVG